jgi:serine/threonine protein kinase
MGINRVGNKLNILMEYVPGKSMDTMLEKFGAFTEKVIQSYTRQLLLALEYCHQNHVVHRDIKGKNILIDTKGTLKLADFGSAKRFQSKLIIHHM